MTEAAERPAQAEDDPFIALARALARMLARRHHAEEAEASDPAE